VEQQRNRDGREREEERRKAQPVLRAERREHGREPESETCASGEGEGKSHPGALLPGVCDGLRPPEPGDPEIEVAPGSSDIGVEAFLHAERDVGTELVDDVVGAVDLR
jgi:hypothetical protein